MLGNDAPKVQQPKSSMQRMAPFLWQWRVGRGRDQGPEIHERVNNSFLNM